MIGGLRPLIYPATWVTDIDVEGTRAARALYNQLLRERQALDQLRAEESKSLLIRHLNSEFSSIPCPVLAT